MESDMLLKRCSECGIEKDIEAFYRTSQGKVLACCKTCSYKKSQAYQTANKLRIRLDMPAEKICNRCHVTKPLSEFHKNAGTRDGYNYACKPCAIAVVMKSFQRHPETVHKARQRDYHSASQHARNQRKRMNRKGAPQNDFTLQQWVTMQERYSFCCAYCGRVRKRLTQDHIIPLSRGGAHTASNIVPACYPCNTRKHNKMGYVPLHPLVLLSGGK
jgi:5-methylcytosine-specific restriction endonuclease McrA